MTVARIVQENRAWRAPRAKLNVRRAVLRAVEARGPIGGAHAFKFCREVRRSAGSLSRSAGGFATIGVTRHGQRR
jgi:hypothetical protein